MVYFSPATKEITAKIVYYGPGMCGKTTNLQKVHELMRPQMKSELVSVATETDRTIYFDFLPVKLGKIAGFDFVVRSFTVPGQPYYGETRKMVLQGADGVVFVADSQRYMLDQNKDSMMDLKRNLKLNGLDFYSIPLIIQYNKRDLPDILDVADLDAALNERKVPTFTASAFRGTGVVETLKAVTLTVFKHVRDGGLAGINGGGPRPAGAAAGPGGLPVTASSSFNPPTNSGLSFNSPTNSGSSFNSPTNSGMSFNAPTNSGAAAPAPPTFRTTATPSAGFQGLVTPGAPAPRAMSAVPATSPMTSGSWGPPLGAGPTPSQLANQVHALVQNAEEGAAPMPTRETIGLQEFQNLAVLHHRLAERVAQLEKELQRVTQEHQDLKRIVGRKLMGS